jgi:AcrR family transcriptional regulator
VDTILEATIQVLLDVGKERLTTTRVALRVGVSAGTWYRYLPNKSAGCLKRHLDDITEPVEQGCRDQKANPLQHMATTLLTAFLDAKMRDAVRSVALYSVNSDVDLGGSRSGQKHGLIKRSLKRLTIASAPVSKDPQPVAAMLQRALAGVSRRLLESGVSEKHSTPCGGSRT